LRQITAPARIDPPFLSKNQLHIPLDVQIVETENKGRAIMGSPDSPLAEMTFSKAGPQLIIIDHTDVTEQLKGKNAGRQLLNALVQKAREQQIKILPLCPFAKSVFDKDPSIRDVLFH
jgi:uncharacterized protein